MTGLKRSLAFGCVTLASVFALASFLGSCGEPDPVCANGAVEGPEECDDGNLIGGDGCNAQCGAEFGWECSAEGCAPDCGDGHVVGWEVCDPGTPGSPVYCSFFCDEVLGRCGDGIFQESRESCEPGATPVRGCNSYCQQEFGFDCSGSPSVCTASGVTETLPMNDLDDAQREQFCGWLIETMGGPGAVYICGDTQFTNYSISQCASNLPDISFGACTVADMEDHVAQTGDRCSWSLGSDPACIG